MKQVKRTTKKVTKKTTKKAQAKKKVEPTNKSAEVAVAPEPEKVFDISKPGESVADAGSKPVLATKRTIVQDPMVTPITLGAKNAPQADAVTVTNDTKPEIRPTKIRLEPLHNVVPEEAASADKPEEATAFKEAPDKALASEESKPEETPADAPATEGPTEEEAVKEAPADFSGDDAAPKDPEPAAEDASKDEGDLGTDPQKAAQSAEAAAAEKRISQANALIESKAYFVPINSVKKRQSLRVLVLVVFVALVLIGGLIALDAGLVDLGIKAPTDFIPN